MLLLAGGLVLLASVALSNHYRWPLVELRGAVLRVGRPRFVPVPLDAVPDDLRADRRGDQRRRPSSRG